MKPLFWYALELHVSTPPAALTRLARAGVFVFDAAKTGPGRLQCKVKCKDLQKFFAIFPRSCYTVRVTGRSRAQRAAAFLRSRAALLPAALAFVLILLLSDCFVLGVRFTGSGSRYAEDARAILREAGIAPFSLYDEERRRAAEKAVSALPFIEFCSLRKEGTVVTVTLQEKADVPLPVREEEFLSPADGVVESLVVLRGRALVKEGETVRRGQALVSGEILSAEGEPVRQTFPAGRLSLLCRVQAEAESEVKSAAAEKLALARAMLLAEGEIVSHETHIRGQEGGYIYAVTVTYRLLYSVNAGG